MKILIRENTKEIFVIFCICIFSILSLLLIGRILQLKDLFIGQSVTIFDLLKIFIFLSPAFLILLIPISCMLSIFLCYLRMATDRELIALQSAGLSIKEFILSPLCFSVFCAGLTAFVSFYALPTGMDKFRQVTMEIIRTKTQLVLKPGVFNRDFPGLTFFAQKVDPRQGKLTNVFVEDATKKEAVVNILAPEGSLVTDSQKGEMYFTLYNGQIYQQTREDFSVISFSKYNLRLNLSKILGGFKLDDKRPGEMSWQELKQARKKFAHKKKDYRRIIMEMHKRFVLPLACLVLGLFALPLGMSLEGVGRQYGVVLALVFFLVYYAMFSIAFSLGETGKLPAQICLWIPNFIFTFFAILGYYLCCKGREMALLQKFRFCIKLKI
ncbi:LPS export ABC transporter permease LptF [Desulfohalobiaceae bacterium Ax17]|uniref:LPS export ABC transporter permease LptF n=1 Tax=Desulfovulcanus ferrireducens TaxID=2831190 RepID=UPI00207BCEA1|nr:LPS export ABC transporter permease LptF [Desulfovulcanus ferrireducens]MBT8762348.1 LPS export ABC transporter permease LptF [Desulfovulcanus ferrireducens]